MRSIGKVKIKKLNSIIAEEVSKVSRHGVFDFNAVKSAVDARIPEDWFYTWESAHSEIERLVSDRIYDLYYRR